MEQDIVKIYNGLIKCMPLYYNIQISPLVLPTHEFQFISTFSNPSKGTRNVEGKFVYAYLFNIFIKQLNINNNKDSSVGIFQSVGIYTGNQNCLYFNQTTIPFLYYNVYKFYLFNL